MREVYEEALSYLPTSRRDAREIRPLVHSLSQEHSTALHHTQSTLLEQHLPAAGRSVSILLYIPRSFRLPPPSILVHLSVSPSLSFFPSRSISIYLPVCLSLSPPPPLSRRQEKSFVVGSLFLRHFLLALGDDDQAVSTSVTPQSEMNANDDESDSDDSGDVVDGEGDVGRD